jgi:hypothetical protein
MKKSEASKPSDTQLDDMLPEYDLDYRKARPNRFAPRVKVDNVIITLDPDVAEVFTTSESVNAVLRALIATMPTTGEHATAEKRSTNHKSA